MKTFRISFLRMNGDKHLPFPTDNDTICDEVEFTVEDGDETELLELFADFLNKTGHQLYSILGVQPLIKSGCKTHADESPESMSLIEAVEWLKKYQGYLPIDRHLGVRHSFDLNDATVDAILSALRRQKSAASTEKEHDPRILNLYELSTAHLTQETRSDLQNQSPAICEHIAVYDSEYGWFLTTMINDTSELPDDLARCIDYAREKNCCWLHFDSDVEICDALPLYD